MMGLEEGQTPLSLFLEEVSLISDIDDYEPDSGAVTLLTLHMAKGLEFPVVFIAGLEDGILPHSRSIEAEDQEEMAEERRLAYVGMTRAKKRLQLIHASRRTVWGQSEDQMPSRFLDEVPENLLTGMVDRRARQAAAFNRATSWESGSLWNDDDSWDTGPSRSSHRGRSSSGGRVPDGGQVGRSGRAQNASSGATYWSPGGQQVTGGAPQGGGKRTEAKGQFRARDSVQHAKFGVGTVIESKIENGDEVVTVAFPGIGVKQLLASFAGLKKL